MLDGAQNQRGNLCSSWRTSVICSLWLIPPVKGQQPYSLTSELQSSLQVFQEEFYAVIGARTDENTDLMVKYYLYRNRDWLGITEKHLDISAGGRTIPE